MLPWWAQETSFNRYLYFDMPWYCISPYAVCKDSIFTHNTLSVIFKLLTWWNGSDVFNSQARTESRSLFIKTFIEEFEYWKWYIFVPLGGGHKKCRWRVQGSHHAGPGQCHIPDKQSGHIFAENLRCSDGSAKTDGVLRQLADSGELCLSLNRKHQNLLKSNASHY